MTPSEVTSVLKAATAPANEDRLSCGADALARLAGSGYLPELLHAIRDDANVASHCAEMSYRHPLGFDKMVLIDATPSFLLRLHAWWPESQPEVEHIHNHRFGVASAVLCGYYDMQVFQRSSTGMPMTEYRERTGSDKGTWVLESLGAVRLEPVIKARIGRGAHYALTRDAMHAVTVPQGSLCITLFLAVPDTVGIRSETRVFARAGCTARRPGISRGLATDQYRKQLDAVAAELTLSPTASAGATAGSRGGCSCPDL